MLFDLWGQVSFSLVMCEEFFESQSLWILEVLKESK